MSVKIMRPPIVPGSRTVRYIMYAAFDIDGILTKSVKVKATLGDYSITGQFA